MITVLHTGNPPNSFTGCGGFFFAGRKRLSPVKRLNSQQGGAARSRRETAFFKTGSAHKKAGCLSLAGAAYYDRAPLGRPAFSSQLFPVNRVQT